MLNLCCSCQTTLPSSENGSEIIDEFYRLRDCCSALQLTIPDDLIEKHRKFTSTPLDDANHCSIPFHAFRNGHISDFTKSIHQFSSARSNLTNQYKQDLRETWIFESNELSRYKKSRNYLSRLAEFHFAQWLEEQQWQIKNLEMYGGKFDVEGLSSRDSTATSFEVKFLGQRELIFELTKESFTNPKSQSLGVYSPIDYLLFRLHEAALQLRKSNTRKIAVAIVSDYDLSYRLPLTEGWIDWSQPKFFKLDSEINNFLPDKYVENPDLDSDLVAAISELNEIWILRYKNNFELHREHKIIIS